MVKQLAAGNRELMVAIENLLDASAEEMRHVKRVVIDISPNDVPQVYVHSYVWDNDRLTSLIRELTAPGAAEVHEVPAPGDEGRIIAYIHRAADGTETVFDPAEIVIMREAVERHA